LPTPTPIVSTQVIQGCVLSNQALTSRLFALRVEASLSDFEAGQFVRLELCVNDEKVAKPYSLVNPPGDPVAEVFFNTVPNGRLSNALAKLQAGDPVGISQPAVGFFTLSEAPVSRDLWMLATGTGLGPYLSILRTPELWQRFKNVVLVHGVPLREELVYRDIIDAVATEHKGSFQYISCVSREENPEGLNGRITQVLEKGKLEQKAALEIDKSFSTVMLCGNHNMIADMQILLSQRDMQRHLRHKPGQILTEQYF